MKSTTINIMPFGATLLLIMDKGLEKVNEKYNTPDLSGYSAVTLKNNNERRQYVMAFDINWYKTSFLVHEIVHLVNYIYLDCGVELDRINDENQAYFTQYLFELIEKEIQALC